MSQPPTEPAEVIRTSDNQLFCCKSIDKLISESETPGHRLQKTLGPWSLTALGIGAVIGSGIFVLTGTAAAGEYFKAPSILHAQVLDIIVNFLRGGSTSQILMHGRPPAGPSIAISFLLVALACSFAGLCYAELASMIPIAGSAYTYSYATLGEIFAWIIGWDLILEYVVSNVVVAIGFAAYTKAQLESFGMHLPDRWSTPVWESGHWTGAYFNIPAFLIIFILTVLLVRGIRESAEANNIMVAIKIGAILTFLVVGGALVNPSNWKPFAPSGFGGIVTGGAIVFFTYIGFDSVSTAAEESRNPQRDLPIGIIASLIVCTILYVGVSVVLLGMMKYTTFVSGPAADAPVAYALQVLGASRWSRSIIVIGALTGMISSSAGVSIRTGTNLVCHVARRTFPQVLFKNPSQVQDSPLVDVDCGIRRRSSRRHLRNQRCRRSLQHRHSLRLRAGLAGRDHSSPHAAGPSSYFQSAARAVVPADLYHPVRRFDDRPHRDYMGPLPRLAGAGPADLLVL